MKQSQTFIRLRRQFAKKSFLAKLVFAGIGIFFLVGLFNFIAKPAIEFGKSTITKNSAFTLKNDNGRTNILILGTGGQGHEGPNLTDTIIVASATGSGQVTMISIPRDIYLDSLQGKINSAYEIGLNSGADLEVAKESVSQVTGLPIHYAVVIDFSVFERVIDILGGIDVNVPVVLDDYTYPIDGKETDSCGLTTADIATISATIFDENSAAQYFPCRYEHLHFDTGLQHMDGKTALAYVRSRHAVGDEGTDFARSRRQQLVIKAVKEKVLSANNFLNPLKLQAIYSELKSHIDTDMDFSRPDQLLALGLNYRNSTIKNVYLDLTLLENPPVDQRGWILLPISGNWDEVHKYIKSQL